MIRKNYLDELHERLMSNISEHITLEQASELTGVSKSKLKADFLTVYGMPFYTYIRTQRMKQAAEMLLNSDCRINEAAAAVGYKNSSKFAKAFSDVIGCTPSEYIRNGGKLFLFDDKLADTNPSVSVNEREEA